MQATDLKGLTVFVVDDNPHNLNVIVDHLKDLEVTTVPIRSGLQMLDLVQRRRPDLILLDIIMPEPDGFEICRRLKADEATRDIPVIFLSVLDQTVNLVKGLELGAVDYLSKPIDPEELHARMKTHLTLLKAEKQLRTFTETLELKIEERTSELKRSEQNFRQLLASSPVAISVCDSKGRLTYVNNRFTQLFGYTLEDMPTEDRWLMLAYPDEAYRNEVMTEWKNRINTYVETESTFEPFEARVTCKDGTVREIEFNFEAIGEIYVSSHVDITERKRAEETLRQYEFIVNSSKDLMTLIGTDYRYLAVSESFCVCHRKEREDIIGRTVAEIWGDEAFLTSIKPNLDRCLEGDFVEYERWFSVPAHGLRYHEVQYTPFFSTSGPFRCAVVVSRDMTTARVAGEKLKKSLKEKELLLRELYHRTKNNIQVIISMLRLRARHDDHSRVKEIFEEMQNKMLSMALAHQKLYESGDLTRLNLKDYVDGLIHLLKNSLLSPSKCIEMHIEGDEVEVLLDTAIPCGIIINELVTNSVKHAFPGGQAGRIDIGLHVKGDNKIVMEVADNGTGLPEDFDYRTDGDLGFRTVIDLVEYQLDGEIQFENKEGFYCMFTMNTELFKEDK